MTHSYCIGEKNGWNICEGWCVESVVVWLRFDSISGRSGTFLLQKQRDSVMFMTFALKFVFQRSLEKLVYFLI